MNSQVLQLLESLYNCSVDKLEISLEFESNDISIKKFDELIKKFHNKFVINCITNFSERNIQLLRTYQEKGLINKIVIMLDKDLETLQIEYIKICGLENVVYHINYNVHDTQFLKKFKDLDVIISNQQDNSFLPDFSAIEIASEYQNKHNLIFTDFYQNLN